MNVIVTNYGNWHRENLRLDRENTGNLKIQLEWIACLCQGVLLLPKLSKNLPSLGPRLSPLCTSMYDYVKVTHHHTIQIIGYVLNSMMVCNLKGDSNAKCDPATT